MSCDDAARSPRNRQKTGFHVKHAFSNRERTFLIMKLTLTPESLWIPVADSSACRFVRRSRWRGSGARLGMRRDSELPSVGPPLPPGERERPGGVSTVTIRPRRRSWKSAAPRCTLGPRPETFGSPYVGLDLRGLHRNLHARGFPPHRIQQPDLRVSLLTALAPVTSRGRGIGPRSQGAATIPSAIRQRRRDHHALRPPASRHPFAFLRDLCAAHFPQHQLLGPLRPGSKLRLLIASLAQSPRRRSLEPGRNEFRS